jgi:urea-proton symporter
MNVLTQTQGYVLVVFFGAAMVGLTWFISRAPKWKHTGTGFLVAGRDVPWYLAAPSIAASWIWAPALFVSVQKAYELGLPGIFWFTAPNVLALVIFAFLAPRVRSRIPGGYTLPEWIKYRLDDKKVHLIYMIPYIWYQIMAVTVQLFVGGMMLNFLTGIPLNTLMILMLVVAMIYSLISGLRASIITDLVQMAFIILGGIIILPWVASVAGPGAISKGFGGLANNTNILDPKVAFSFGIVTSIGLIAGAISDQQYWQRSFAVRQKHLIPSFVVGGILFGIVPIALSILGFIAANPDMGISLSEGTGLPMIGIATVAKLLPTWAAVFFVIMLLAGLCSTLDSGLCAASSLYAVDMVSKTNSEQEVLRKERLGLALAESDRVVKQELDRKTMGRARSAMFGIGILGLITAFIVQHLFGLDRLWWIFNGVASCFVVPTIMSIYYDRLSAQGVLYGIMGALIGMVVFVYGNWVQNDIITVCSAVFIIVISLVCCFVFKRETPWQGDLIAAASEGAD